MKAIVLTQFGGSEHLQQVDRPLPEPAAGEVRIKVRAVGFNPVDIWMRRGNAGGTLPLLLGRDVSGVIDAVGTDVRDLAPGDAVYARCIGAYAEYVTAPAAFVCSKPVTLSFPEAAAIPIAGLTAYQCVATKAHVRPGQAVLVAGGAGGVGSFAVQLLRDAGASPLLVTAGSDSSAAYLVHHLGVDPSCVLRYRGRSRRELADLAVAKNRGRHFDAAFDFVGGDMKRLCFDVIGVDGHVVSIVEEPPEYDLNLWDDRTSALMLKSASFHFVQLGARSALGDPATWTVYREQLATLGRLIDEGRVRPPLITALGGLSIESVCQAHRALEDGHVQGKLVMTIDDGR